jgi:hypothetical protein
MSDVTLPGTKDDVAMLLSPATVRARAAAIHQLAQAGGTHFRIHEDRLPATAELVARVTRENYPQLEVPFHSRWSHFRVGGFDRVAELEHRLSGLDAHARAKAKLDLAVTSVLLDAGAGMAWRYREPGTEEVFSRSEGLAVASLHLFLSGAFSSDPTQPWRVDAAGLAALSADTLARGFQVTEANPLVGLEGRLNLLRALGSALRGSPTHFRGKNPRPGDLLDFFERLTGQERPVRGVEILEAVQRGFGAIWPGRVRVNNFNLGDAWVYAPLGEGLGACVPFHKLSQWLTYSLVDPLREYGLPVTGLEELTALAEYRNGGLLIDAGVLELRDPTLAEVVHAPGSELVVEWRALTVHLLEGVAERVRALLGKSATEMPLGRVLEGGTWWAGRKLAAEKRADGGPPLKIASDGTVF